MRATKTTRKSVNPIITGMNQEGQRQVLGKQYVTQPREDEMIQSRMDAMEKEMFKRKGVIWCKKVLSAQVIMCPTISASTFTDPSDVSPPSAQKACSERSRVPEESMETK